MNYKIFKGFTIALMLVLTACSNTTIRKNANFVESDVLAHEIISLPTEAVVNTVDFGGKKERMHDYEYYIEDKINEALIAYLNQNGVGATLLNKKNIHDKGLSKNALMLRESFDANIEELYKAYVMPEEKAFAITNKVDLHNLVLGNKDNQLFLLSNYVADVKTSGARTADFLAGVASAYFGGHNSSADQAEAAKIIVGLVDAKTGLLLWSNAYTLVKDSFSSMFESMGKKSEKVDEERAKHVAETVLRPLFEPKK